MKPKLVGTYCVAQAGLEFTRTLLSQHALPVLFSLQSLERLAIVFCLPDSFPWCRGQAFISSYKYRTEASRACFEKLLGTLWSQTAHRFRLFYFILTL